jgi:hypothetical protein
MVLKTLSPINLSCLFMKKIVEGKVILPFHLYVKTCWPLKVIDLIVAELISTTLEGKEA